MGGGIAQSLREREHTSDALELHDLRCEMRAATERRDFHAPRPGSSAGAIFIIITIITPTLVMTIITIMIMIPL